MNEAKMIEYTCSALDANDTEWAKGYLEIKGSLEWKGIIEKSVEEEKLIIANVNTRGSNFKVVLVRHYYMNDTLSEWCVCVPNWNIGMPLCYLQKERLFSDIANYIDNKVDAISLTNAIWTLTSSLREGYFAAAKKQSM